MRKFFMGLLFIFDLSYLSFVQKKKLENLILKNITATLGKYSHVQKETNVKK